MSKEPSMNRNHRWPESLRTLELFSDCDAAELRRIGSLLTPVTVEPGKTLLIEAGHDRQFIVIAEGELSVTQHHNGTERELARLGPGDFVGEISLLDHSPRSATVTAITASTVYASNAREFDALLEASPSVAHKIRSAATTRLRSNLAGV
jgi:CRP-like cAMP-binding protein